MITTVKFAKTKPNAKIPTKRDEDAGFDIYACFEENYMIIPPHETVMIPTGIASAFGSDYCVILKERGSTGTKGMAQRSGVIDSGYRGEWLVPITNTTTSHIVISKTNSLKEIFGKAAPIGCVIYPYEKAICQALVVPVPYVEVEEYTYEELKTIPSARGEGHLGSSNK